MDLAEFLTARLNEDERAAAEVHLARTCDCIDRDGDFHMFPGEACGCEYPARVLREVEAKRAILAEHVEDGCSDLSYHRILEMLAAVYSDHPDYDPAWA